MANVNVNTGQRRVFEHGGTFEIVGATDTYIVANIVPGGGSLEWTPGLREVKIETNQGALIDPLEGNDRPTTVKISIRYTSAAEANGVYALLAATGSSGLAKTYGLIIRIPSHRGSSTGETITFTKASVVPGNFSVKAGSPFDSIDAEFMCAEARPTVATY